MSRTERHHVFCKSHTAGLRLTEAIQKALFGSFSVSVIATDNQGGILFINRGTEVMLGYSIADLSDSVSIVDIIDVRSTSERATTMSEYYGKHIDQGFDTLVFNVRRGVEDRIDLEFAKKDGGRLAVVSAVSQLSDIHNAFIGYVFISTDNSAPGAFDTGHSRLDQFHHDRDDYNSLLSESAIDVIIATDSTGIIAGANKQMEIVTGRTRSELIGTRFEDHFTDPIQARSTFDHVMSESVVSDYVLTLRDSNGAETSVSCNASVLSDRNGHPRGILVGARDLSQLMRTERHILDFAYHDSLTRLANRRLLTVRLEQAMALSRRSGRYGALIFLDLDNFKIVNDTNGHNVGDSLLAEAAHRITACVREVDFVARYGGDEFVVILGDLDSDKPASIKQSMIVATKILAALGQPYLLHFTSGDGVEISTLHQCTSSIGVALFLNHLVPTNEVVRWADTAMYEAKRTGGNSIKLFDPDFNTTLSSDFL